MASPQELVQAVREARSEAEAAIGECNEKWESKPAAGEGEDAWSPKEVAQHIIGAEWFFTNMIGQACGAQAMERPQIDVSTPHSAVASLRQVGGTDDRVLRHVTEGDLTKTYETRNLGTRSVEEMLTIIVSHGRDHVNQLRAANA